MDHIGAYFTIISSFSSCFSFSCLSFRLLLHSFHRFCLLLLSGRQRLQVIHHQRREYYLESQVDLLFLFSILHLQLIDNFIRLSPDPLSPQPLRFFVNLNYRFPYQIYLNYLSNLPFPYQPNLLQQVYLSYQPNRPIEHRFGDQDYQYYRLRHVN